MSDDFMLDELRERNMQRRLTDECERCALLAETMALSNETRAAQYRKDGTRITRLFWPPFKKTTDVDPDIEHDAKMLEIAAIGFRTVALGCRAGWDPRTPAENERIDVWRPCLRCTAPMDCASWKCCERGLSDEEIARDVIPLNK